MQANITEKSTSALQMCFFLYKGYQKDIFTVCNKDSNPSKINAFRLAEKRQEVLVKSEE